MLFVYAQFGIDLPHNEAGQLASGERVDAAELEPGDVLVFANTYRRGLSHVGIYVGDGHIMQAPQPGDVVRMTVISAAGWVYGYGRPNG